MNIADKGRTKGERILRNGRGKRNEEEVVEGQRINNEDLATYLSCAVSTMRVTSSIAVGLDYS